MKYSGITTVWFDLDDTLWDFRTNSRILLEKIYGERGLESWFDSAEQWIKSYEAYNQQLWRDYAAGRISRDFLLADRFRKPLTDAGHPDAETEGRFLDGHYLERLGEMDRTVVGAKETLEMLRTRGYKIGVLSNGFESVQHRKLRASGLDELVDLTVLSDDIGITKPDRRLFDHAAARAGARPEQCLMVGDNPLTDIGGALAAGWNAIYFRRNPDEKAPEGVDEIGNLGQISYFLCD